MDSSETRKKKKKKVETYSGNGESKKMKSQKHVCQVCEEEFDTVSEYWEHSRLHDPTDKVVCTDCHAEFSTLHDYRLHAKKYPLPHCFQCDLCLQKYVSEKKLDSHTCVCFFGKPMLCACGLEFTTYSALLEHSRGSSPFQCCSCGFKSPSFSRYKRHIRFHTKQKPFRCTKCEIYFSSLELVRNHLRTVHDVSLVSEDEPLIFCDICVAGFPSSEEVKAHMATHKERVICPECGKVFRAENISQHRLRHKQSSSLCPECGRLFDSPMRLSQHLATIHTTDHVTCDHCGKTLKTKKILIEHLKTHLKTEVGTRVPQAICPICGLKLAQKGSLLRHIVLVHERHKLAADNKPRQCHECGIVCPNNAKYYTHRRQHRALVERFPCTVCSREFNKKQNLVRHMYLLHNSERKPVEPAYTCDICFRSFRERKNLARHNRLVHKIVECTDVPA